MILISSQYLSGSSLESDSAPCPAPLVATDSWLGRAPRIVFSLEMWLQMWILYLSEPGLRPADAAADGVVPPAELAGVLVPGCLPGLAPVPPLPLILLLVAVPLEGPPPPRPHHPVHHLHTRGHVQCTRQNANKCQ